MFNTRVAVGVTGLARAGKTVFITSLIHNLMTARRSEFRHLPMVRDNRLLSVSIVPPKDLTVPEFRYHDHVRALTGEQPVWPKATTGVSRIAVRIQLEGAPLHLGGLSLPVTVPERTVDLEIVDYPGEWLLDLPLMALDYESWCRHMGVLLRRPERRDAAAPWLERLKTLDPAQPHDEGLGEALATLYTEQLQAAAAAGLRYNQPGRFLLPMDLAGSPILRFVPLDLVEGVPAQPGSLHGVFRSRFDAYRKKVVAGFAADYFLNLDRQIVLVDVLRALNDGAVIFEDRIRCLRDIVAAFRYGRRRWFRFLGGRRIDRVLFAATKADHVVDSDRRSLAELLEKMLIDLDERNAIAATGTEIRATAIAAIAATRDYIRESDGRDALVGRRSGDAQDLMFVPGAVRPEFPPLWDKLNYRFFDFELLSDHGYLHEGLPTYRMRQVVEQLIGDYLS